MPFIIPHLGSFADDWRAQRAFLDPLVRHANVFTDTSGVRRFDLLAEAVERAGRARCSSARTAHGCIPASSWRRSSRWSFPAALRMILRGNFLRLIDRVRPRRRRPSGPRGMSAPIAVPQERPDPWLERRGVGVLVMIAVPAGECVPQRGPAQLQGAIGHAQPLRGTLQVALLLPDGESDGGALGDAADLLQRRSEQDGLADRALEGRRRTSPRLRLRRRAAPPRGCRRR